MTKGGAAAKVSDTHMARSIVKGNYSIWEDHLMATEAQVSANRHNV
jgi:hypothetical protein